MKDELFQALDAAPPHAGALEELVGHLRRDALPDAWLAEHAPDGRLEPAWLACGNPRVLIRLIARESEPEVLATALLALVQKVVPAGTTALDALSVYAEGAGSREALVESFEELELQEPSGALRVLRDALHYLLDERERIREGLLASLFRNLRSALEPDVEPAEDVPSELVLHLADELRAAVRCPSLHALIQKYCPAE